LTQISLYFLRPQKLANCNSSWSYRWKISIGYVQHSIHTAVPASRLYIGSTIVNVAWTRSQRAYSSTRWRRSNGCSRIKFLLPKDISQEQKSASSKSNSASDIRPSGMVVRGDASMRPHWRLTQVTKIITAP
jgi:hypothetical protein